MSHTSLLVFMDQDLKDELMLARRILNMSASQLIRESIKEKISSIREEMNDLKAKDNLRKG